MSLFLDQWKEKQYEIFSQLYPELSRAEIMEVLEDDIKEKFNDPMCQIHNDYQDNMLLEQPLTTLYQFCREKKPILGGNGTLFYNQDKVTSPVEALIVDRITARKSYQKIRDTYGETGEHPDPEMYAHYDMMQMEAKVRINSIYGSFGAPTFRLYNRYTAAATTGTAQSLISTTGVAFESFLDNSVKFKTFDECIDFLFNIKDEEYKLDKLSIRIISDRNVVYDRILDCFAPDVYEPDKYDEIIWTYLNSIDEFELTKIYYKNNIFEFIENRCIKDILIDSYNKIESFNNPNKVPEEIADNMALLWEYCSEYVFYNHSYTERINRIKNDGRTMVKVIDTDSNMVYVQPWVDYVNINVIPYTHTNMSQEYINFAAVNTIAYLITCMLKELLSKYCFDCNVLERYHFRINMKNEFCFTTMLLAPTKKRYVAKIVLKEGKPVVKTEIKGHDFKKAGVTEYLKDKMTKIVEDRILEPADVDMTGILSDLRDIEKEVYESLNKGERKYLLRMNCKVPEAYKNPESMGQVNSVLVWNTIYPEQEIILPDKLDVILVKIPNLEALSDMAINYPYEYERFKVLFNSGYEPFVKNGIKYLAIPNNIPGIPDFIKPYIDYQYIASRNIGTFKSIMESLEYDINEVSSGGKKMYQFTNIRRDTTLTI